MINKIKIFVNKRQQVSLILLLVGILISAGLEMIGLGAIPVFIKLLLNPEQFYSYLPQTDFVIFISNKDYLYQILFAAISLLVIFTFKNSFIFAVGYMETSIFRNIRIDNSKRLLQSYLNSPYSLHLNRNPAILTRNIIGEVDNTAEYINSLLTVIRETSLITVIFILLLIANPMTSLIALLIVGLFSISFHYIIRKKMTDLSKLGQYHRGRQVQLINQIFGAIKDTKILARESFFTNEFKNETQGAERIKFFSQLVSRIPRLSMEIFAVIIILLVTLMFVVSGRSMDTMIPILGLLGIATIRIVPAFNALTTTLAKMRNSVVSFNLVTKELKNLEQYSESKKSFLTNSTDKNLFSNKNIKIKNISFTYPNANKEVLKNVSFNIKPGTSVAIIGKTGSGKSTLADIILGLLEPSKGQIIVGDSNINKNYLMWQSEIGYIPQDIYLIDDSIKRNIAFGIPDNEIDENKIKNSIKLAQLDNFISDLPSGINTTVGDRGIRLSGGQRQRIGIARALYRKTKILIFDEATSSLDIETEKNLIKDIEALRSDYTIITVTHRLPTIKNCDEIFLLSNGKLVDHGHYNELVSRNNELKGDYLR